MAELLTRMVAGRPAATAIRDDFSSVDWAGLNRRVNRWINLFRANGLGAGDVVSFVTGNRIGTFEALLAGMHAGITIVPVNWHLTAGEIAYILADSGSRALLTQPEHADVAAEAAAKAGTISVGLVLGDEPHAGLTPVEPLLAKASDTEPADQCSGDVLLYTSGTTGHPKGVVSGRFVPGAPVANVAGTVELLGTALGIRDGGRGLLVGPWYHSAQVFFTMFPLLRGCDLVLRERFDAADTLATIDRDGVTICHLVPTQFVRLLRTDPAGFTGASLERVWHGGGPCPVDVKRAMIEWWGPVLYEYYAGTESGITTVIDSPDWLAHPGSVGRAVPPNQLVVVDGDGVEQSPGTTGTVYLRRPPDRDFSYHNAPEKTAAAHREPGMFTLGDVGHVDAAGYLYLTGRSVDLIVTGGVNVYPAEIEAVLQVHPAVRDVAVVGVPDPEFGEQVKAVVELEDGVSATDEELDRHCRAALAGFKVPRSYDFVPSLPREPTGKLRKREIRAGYLAGTP
jgi:long-chain acyl-CoA synthetase